MTRLPLRNDVPFCTAEQAAIHLLCIARDRNTPINHRQLQNLLYYAQGYSLSLGESLLFIDDIELAKDEPVVRHVEDTYKCHGEGPIPVPDDLHPQRRAVMPGMLLQTVFAVVMESDAKANSGRLSSEAAWRATWGNEGLADPRVVATWWSDRTDRLMAKREPQPQVSLSEYLRRRPEIVERLRKRYEPHELIPWR